MDGNPVQKIVKAVLEQYDTQIVPKLSLFRKCKTFKLLIYLLFILIYTLQS